MAFFDDQQINTGSYVPTTNVWDVSRLYELEVDSPEFKELLVRLYQNINNISIVLNTKCTGYYVNEQFVSGKLFFNANPDPLDLSVQFRPGFLISVNTGALGAGVTAVNHNIDVTNTFQWMFIYGAATNTGTLVGYPLPFAGAAGNNIEVSVTATQVVINNASGVTFTDSQVTLEYCKLL
jgi:hypothetical protein